MSSADFADSSAEPNKFPEDQSRPQLSLPSEVPIDTAILVPGFMSPAWMMWPLAHSLTNEVDSVVRWDYPRVFTDIEATIRSLASEIQSRRSHSQHLAIVTHSFGDWIARSALQRIEHHPPTRVVSICPVTTRIVVASFMSQLTRRVLPELSVMSNQSLAEVPLPSAPSITHRVIWASGELLVPRYIPDPHPSLKETTVLGMHNSVLWQPNLWRQVKKDLSS
ncbi:esterase/lipase family protein [Novipirellula sp. SH528]|uniref:esterase/lipase family protein n=1 Tax=Novipirellula sp. SH528 TaxID=3454466 RepID=UPI003F9FB634